jgi:diguanylate cyclase (GGDEF)-like protein
MAALLALAVATVTTGASYWIAQAQAGRAAHDTLAGLIDAVRNTAAIGAYAGDRVLLEEVANGLVRHPLVGEVQIRLLQGTGVTRQREGASADADVPQVAQPLRSPFDASETLGEIRVRADAGRLAEEARRQALLVALPMLGQVLLLTGVLAVMASRLLSRPMSELARQVATLEPGTAARIPVPRRHDRNEIGRLIRRTNALLGANAAALETERELRGQVSAIEGRLRRLLDSSSAAIFLVDHQARLISGNPTLVRLCTGDAGASLDAEHFAQQQFAQPEQFHWLVERALTQGHSQSADLKLQRGAEAEGGHWVHVLLSPLASESGEQLLEGVLYDVTQRRHEEQHARHRAHHDELTGLRNRAGLRAELDRAVAAAQAGGSALSLLYLDLDGFKRINDERGHAMGDLVLREVAQRLQGLVRRADDVVARLGGDEFVLLLRADAAEAHVIELAWRVVAALNLPILLPDGSSGRIGASVGLAGLPRDAVGAEELLREADQAMYGAKRAGKNRVATPQGLLERPQDATS